MYLSALLQVLQCTSVLQYGSKDEQNHACYIVPIFMMDGAKHLYSTPNCTGYSSVALGQSWWEKKKVLSGNTVMEDCHLDLTTPTIHRSVNSSFISFYRVMSDHQMVSHHQTLSLGWVWLSKTSHHIVSCSYICPTSLNVPNYIIILSWFEHTTVGAMGKGGNKQHTLQHTITH